MEQRTNVQLPTGDGSARGPEWNFPPSGRAHLQLPESCPNRP